MCEMIPKESSLCT